MPGGKLFIPTWHKTKMTRYLYQSKEDFHNKTALIQADTDLFERYYESRFNNPWSKLDKTRKKKEDFCVRVSATETFTERLSKEEIKKALGRKWRYNLADLVKFIDKYKYLTERNRDDIRVIPLSSNSKIMQELFDYQRKAHGRLQCALTVRLIKCTDRSYMFGIAQGIDRSRQYAWDKVTQDLIMELAKEEGLIHKKEARHQRIYSDAVKDLSCYPKLIDKVRICSKMRLRDPYKLSREKFEEVCNAALEKKYPQLIEMKKEADELNSCQFYQENEELQTRLKPSLDYSTSRNAQEHRLSRNKRNLLSKST